ncbi:hypothetical protein [Ponticaulis profundi]|uniref:Uncharacterized protein n=1 Tax=Ponticaulis profundi TaxID=2665222 RepID=A0ABW1S861_9PROT
MLTEDEAREKGCCVFIGSMCSASACMAWQVEAYAGSTFGATLDNAKALIERYPDTYEADIGKTSPMAIVTRKKDVGYCGRAGKP